MRIVRFQDPQGAIHFGCETTPGQAECLQPSPAAAQTLLSQQPDDAAHAAATHADHDAPLFTPTGQTRPIHRLLAPMRPTNIYCIGKNYAAHAAEFDSELPHYPVIFMKPTTALAHPGQPIHIPAACTRGHEVDYEVELAVVIGPNPVRNLNPDDALHAVFAYTIANDVSARRWQKHAGAGQWIRGKSFDTFCPIGPAILTPDEIKDPQNLTLETRVNGQTLQHANTSDMLFTVAQIISFISQDTTLAPGTLILTGTPEGVGFARTPPVFLTPGDTVEVEIESLGVLTNPIEAAPDQTVTELAAKE